MDVSRVIATGLVLMVVGCFQDPEFVKSGDSSSSGTTDAVGSTGESESDVGESTTDADSGGSTTTDGSSSSSSSGLDESTGSAGCSPLVVEQIPVQADTQIDEFDCDGTIQRGGDAFLNIGLGVGLYRFELPAAVAGALRDGNVEWLEVTLARDFDCVMPSCPAEPGVLEVRPLRNDWVEGVLDVPASGADWCRRDDDITMPEPWGEAGARDPELDAGPPTGSVSFDATQPEVAVQLEPGPHAEWVGADAPAMLSLRVEALSGVFVAATRENTVEAAPMLRVAYCPPE